MNELVWHLPRWVHKLILRVTGARLVQVRGARGQRGYVWSRRYPL